MSYFFLYSYPTVFYFTLTLSLGFAFTCQLLFLNGIYHVVYFGFILFDSAILDACPVRGGIYVMTKDGVLFLSGGSKNDFTMTHVHTSKPVDGTFSHIPGGEVGGGDMMQGIGTIFVCKDGVCVGDDGGRVTNMTSRKLVFDTASSGAGCYIPNGQYIFSLEV